MSEPRRHHYLPVFYQIGFSDSHNQRLWVYDRKERSLFHAHPKTICLERELYTADPGGRRDRRIETKLLGPVDSTAAQAIRQLSVRQRWRADQWKAHMSSFTALQILRSPAFRNIAIDSRRQLGESFLRIGFTDVDRARSLMRRYCEDTGAGLGEITAELMVESVINGRLTVDVTERPFLEQILRQLKPLAQMFASRSWLIIESCAGTGFITCDHPVTVVPTGDSEMTGPGVPGSVTLFPLSRRFCLRIGAPGSGIDQRIAGKSDVRVINQNIVISSERFVLCANQIQLESLIERCRAAEVDPSSRCSREIKPVDTDSSLIQMTLWPKRAYIQLRG